MNPNPDHKVSALLGFLNTLFSVHSGVTLSTSAQHWAFSICDADIKPRPFSLLGCCWVLGERMNHCILNVKCSHLSNITHILLKLVPELFTCMLDNFSIPLPSQQLFCRTTNSCLSYDVPPSSMSGYPLGPNHKCFFFSFQSGEFLLQGRKYPAGSLLQLLQVTPQAPLWRWSSLSDCIVTTLSAMREFMGLFLAGITPTSLCYHYPVQIIGTNCIE